MAVAVLGCWVGGGGGGWSFGCLTRACYGHTWPSRTHVHATHTSSSAARSRSCHSLTTHAIIHERGVQLERAVTLVLAHKHGVVAGRCRRERMGDGA